MLATGPLLYHVVSLGILEPHGVAVWVYLIAVTMVSVGLAVRADSTAWRWAAWVAVVLPLMAWVDSHQTSRWLTANLVSAIAVFALHALAQLDRVFRQQRALGRADNVLQHVNGYALHRVAVRGGRGRLAGQCADAVPGGCGRTRRDRVAAVAAGPARGAQCAWRSRLAPSPSRWRCSWTARG